MSYAPCIFLVVLYICTHGVCTQGALKESRRYLDCLTLLFHAAVAVLDHFWNEFNDGMDASAVVRELVQHRIIPQSVQVDISKESSPKQQNQILHAGLKKSCTEEALMRTCDIIIAEGNPRMRRLGVDMKIYLQTGIINGYSYILSVHTFICSCMCVCICICNACVHDTLSKTSITVQHSLCPGLGQVSSSSCSGRKREQTPGALAGPNDNVPSVVL